MTKRAQAQSAADSPRAGARTTYLVTLAHYGLRTRVEQTLKKHGVTGLQYSILSKVAGSEGLSSAELSRHFYVTPQNMGQLLAALEERGLISRQEDSSNRRILRIALTAEGEHLLNLGDADMDALEAEVYGGISEQDVKAFRSVMRHIIKKLRD